MALTYKLISGFETGAPTGDGWTATGTVSDETTTYNSTNGGSHSAKINYNGATERKLRLTYTAAGVRAKFHLYAHVNTNPTSNHTENIFRVITSAPANIATLQLVTDTSGNCTLQVRNDVASTTPISGVSISKDAWHTIQFKVHIDPSNGILELILDGGSANTASSQNTGSSSPNTIDIGVIAPTNNGGSIDYYFDDFILATTDISGDGHVDKNAVVICRQGKSGAPTYNEWTKSSGSDAYSLWSDTPTSGTSNCVSPGTGDPLRQTMLVSAFDSTQTGHGTGTIGSSDTILFMRTVINALRSGGSGRTHEGLWRYASTDYRTTLTLTTSAAYYVFGHSNGTLSLTNVNASEVGGYKSGGAGGQSMTINDAWVMVAYIPTTGTTYSHSGGSVTGTRASSGFGFLAVAKGVSRERTMAGASTMLTAVASGVSRTQTRAATGNNLTALASGASRTSTRAQTFGGLIYNFGGVSVSANRNASLAVTIAPASGVSRTRSHQSTNQSLIAVSSGASRERTAAGTSTQLYAVTRGVSLSRSAAATRSNLFALATGASRNTSVSHTFAGTINAASGVCTTLSRQAVSPTLVAVSKATSRTNSHAATSHLLIATAKGASHVRTVSAALTVQYVVTKGVSSERSSAASRASLIAVSKGVANTDARAASRMVLIALAKGVSSGLTFAGSYSRQTHASSAASVTLTRGETAWSVISVSTDLEVVLLNDTNGSIGIRRGNIALRRHGQNSRVQIYK